MQNPEFYIEKLKKIHAKIRDAVIEKMKTSKDAHGIDRFEHGDFIYNVDVEAEKILEQEFERWGKEEPVVLVAEGIGRKAYGGAEADCKTIVVVDPIDGTREIMYARRPAWAIAGVAPYKEDATLDDIELTVQTAIGKNIFGENEVLWAVKGQGAYIEKDGGKAERLKTLQDDEIEHRFITFQSYFEGFRKPVTDIQEEVLSKFVTPKPGQALTFEDNYLSTAGLLYFLATGRQSAVIDLRPKITDGLGNHVYDVCSFLIATEAGASIDFYDENNSSKIPLSLDSKVGFRAYANEKLKNKIDPILDKVLEEKGYGAPSRS